MKPWVVKMRRVLSLILTALIVLIVLGAVVYVLVPSVVDSVEKLAQNLDEYFETFEKNVDDYIESRLQEGKFWSRIYDHIRKTTGEDGVVRRTGDWVLSLFTEENLLRIFSVGSSVISVLINVILTVFFTIYLLLSKERQAARIRKLLSSIFKKERVEGIYRVAYMTDDHVGRYIRMQVIDCILVGLVSFLVYTILGLPYAPLLAVISGVTNIIPYFGPFIGAVPNGLLILLAAPDKLLPFIIAVVIIQQLDGNILVPILQSSSLRIDTFWVLVGLTVMGGIFGIPGMILGVPFFAVVYFLIRERAERRLQKKGLPVDTDAYIVMHHERKQNHPKPPIVNAINKIRARFKQKKENAQPAKPEGPDEAGPPDEAAQTDEPEAPDGTEATQAPETPETAETTEAPEATEEAEAPEAKQSDAAEAQTDYDLIDRGKEKVRHAVKRADRKKKK